MSDLLLNLSSATERCWCVLIGRMFLYFRSASDTVPLGQINMREARVEDIECSSSDSSEGGEEEEEEGGSGGGGGSAMEGNRECTVAIVVPNQNPTYLLFPTQQDKDQWLYHLTVVSSGGGNQGTAFEQHVQKLMECDGDPGSFLWRSSVLLHTKEPITEPLTSLPTEELQTEAIKLFKSCQLFMSVPVDSAGIDYHVVLAQNAFQLCLDFPLLQTELICCLIKQTSRHLSQRALQELVNKKIRESPKNICDMTSLGKSSGGGTAPPSTCASPTPTILPPPSDCKINPPAFVFIQGWQLLALAHSIRTETEKEKLLHVHQTNQAILKGVFPVSKELALEMAALMAQIETGDCRPEGKVSRGSGGSPRGPEAMLEKYFPKRYSDGLSEAEIKLFKGGATPLWMAVGEDGVSLLEFRTLESFATYAYGSVVTFGGCQDDFMLVVTVDAGFDDEDGPSTQKLLFTMPKCKILELTLLIADYVNVGGHYLPGTPLGGTLTRHSSRASKRHPRTGSFLRSIDSDASRAQTDASSGDGKSRSSK
ncbi:unnamed protein product [Cyprideis torosa]|uniref:Uncharacterized protein n=1 Tax=Cyprideis torosa TaxID=163714 RepID=A0A7R8ZLC3_9CRUS|nr:unnamed protein product [Cyprideis torosa]CAG0891470.1 unnamed protein product [Cyprideis torosa]